MKNCILLGVAVVLILIGVTSVSACYCGRPLVEKAFRQSAAIFVGEVVEVSGPEKVELGNEVRSLYKIRFFVWESWKGTKAIEIEVLGGQSEASCFEYPPLRVGETYLVFADPLPSDNLSPRIQGVLSNCNLTTRLSGPARRPDVDRGNGVREMIALDRIVKRANQ